MKVVQTQKKIYLACSHCGEEIMTVVQSTDLGPWIMDNRMFIYCPWCGKKLSDSPEEEVSSSR